MRRGTRTVHITFFLPVHRQLHATTPGTIGYSAMATQPARPHVMGKSAKFYKKPVSPFLAYLVDPHAQLCAGY